MKITSAAAFGAALVLFSGVSSVEAQMPSSMDWSGRVDNRVNVVVRGRRATTVTIRGNRFPPGRATFRGSVRNANLFPRVRLRQGRGTARVTQRPSSRNNFTTIIRIDDPRAGADRYQIRVNW